MSEPLIITNGDSARQALGRTSIRASILTWDDVLHDGPVPKGLDLDELSLVRARFLSDQGDWTYGDIRKKFEERNAWFREATEGEGTIICWFEHDLYDQLQLWQILSELESVRRHNLELICRDRYLGPADPSDLQQDFEQRSPVTSRQLHTASLLWDAFRDSMPERLLELLESIDLSSLPFARDALQRWLEEFPAVEDGLSRTERVIVTLLGEAKGQVSGAHLFRSYMETEQAAFMSDLSFEAVLRRLATGADPLVRIIEESRSAEGAARQEGASDNARPRSPLVRLSVSARPQGHGFGPGRGIPGGERWMGGVHLQPGMYWYWSRKDRAFVHSD